MDDPVSRTLRPSESVSGSVQNSENEKPPEKLQELLAQILKELDDAFMPERKDTPGWAWGEKTDALRLHELQKKLQHWRNDIETSPPRVLSFVECSETFLYDTLTLYMSSLHTALKNLRAFRQGKLGVE